MGVLSGWNKLAKRITEFELKEKESQVMIRACPAYLWGWLMSKMISNNETILEADKKLLVLEEWGFFGKNLSYVPIKNISAIEVIEKFRTGILIASMIFFTFSISLVYSGYTFAIIEKIKFFSFFSGAALLAIAFILKRRVVVNIYRGSIIHQLKFRATKEQIVKLKKALEMLMLISMGKKK